jgi:hypothetical protein
MAFLKLIIFGYGVLTVVYFSLSLYFRSVQRESLEKRWDRETAKGEDLGDRSAYVEEGMAEYERGFGRRLILLVYILPTVAVPVILYLTNAN